MGGVVGSRRAEDEAPRDRLEPHQLGAEDEPFRDPVGPRARAVREVDAVVVERRSGAEEEAPAGGRKVAQVAERAEREMGARSREVANLAAGSLGSEPRELTSFRGRVFFVADDGRGFSLWSTDGTAAGTRLIEDPSPERSR